jgi:hypothetical protein
MKYITDLVGFSLSRAGGHFVFWNFSFTKYIKRSDCFGGKLLVIFAFRIWISLLEI